jgi:2-oxoglutarate ferredoxin oxidoreductase subunit alpha
MPAADSRQAQHRVGDRIFIDGNSAAALGSVYGGATVAAWYPITPSSSLAEAFMSYCRKFRTDPGHQAKALRDPAGRGRARVDRHGDRRRVERRARVHHDVGSRRLADAGIPGARLLCRDPVVLFDVQRGSPVDRMPTRTQQADLLSCAYASHGDTKHVLLLPEDPTESFAFAAQAFDLADRLQTPIS